MQALVDLINKHRPGFADAVVPAEERRIQSLERLAGPLPGALLRFLRTMGGSPPRLLVESLYLGVDPMRRALLSTDWLKDERYLIVTKHDGYDAQIWMDRATRTPPDDAMLVIAPSMDTPAPTPKTPFAVGLEDHLYVEAFREHRLSLFEHNGFATTYEPLDDLAVQRALSLPSQLGFSRIGGPPTSGLFERGDAAIIVRRAPFDKSIHLHIAAEKLAHVGATVQAYLASPGWKEP